MDTVSFFGLQHGRVHSSRVSSVSSIADQVFGGLTDQQMRAKGLNSLVWLLWHKARVEGAYRDAVGFRTRDVVATLAPASWAEPVNAVDAARVPDWVKRLRRAAASARVGHFGDNAQRYPSRRGRHNSQPGLPRPLLRGAAHDAQSQQTPNNRLERTGFAGRTEGA